MNTGVPWPGLYSAEQRVLKIQTKLHRWAGEDPQRRFCDLFNLVADPAFLRVAWDRVRHNTGARSAGVDGMSARYVEQTVGVEVFLAGIRERLRAGTFRPRPVRERMIPKPGSGKYRRLGIPTVRDRIVQAALKSVLEPIFEQDFRPCSYGFRPRRRAQDAIAEIHYFGSRSYEWVLEADIKACFDEISHSALMGRVRTRIGDKSVLALVKSFLKAGILTELGSEEHSRAGTPQGGILSPLLANIALSVLDDFACTVWHNTMATPSQRAHRRQTGRPKWRPVRYADDFVIMVAGTEAHARQLRQQVAEVLSTMGLRLSEEKTRVVHLDEGFDFLGFRIQRHRKRGTQKRHVYTYPSRASVQRIVAKIRALTHRTAQPNLRILLGRLNSLVGGWCNYFKYGVSKKVFSYLRSFMWQRVAQWIRKRCQHLGWKTIRNRYMNGGWEITSQGVTLFNPASVTVRRYRYRAQRIPTPWSHATHAA
ncbi:group II intron reverse transcriptase/maturase [Actinomadura rubrisoli]|uniref:group II intron reverse transcriptase/maturase n=1 Tax=Actinomadura rubrisoli TaxID=2530368 RepID=UPI001A9D4C8A|nr:group II intron reverse transcriptase/maturase [Actinomadura rubrisoli]